MCAGCIQIRFSNHRKYYPVVNKKHSLRTFYSESFSTNQNWPAVNINLFYKLTLTAKGRRITAGLDRKTVLEAEDTRLGKGGAGLLFDRGIVGFREVKIR